MNYLTDRDYEIANQNGIDKAHAYNRVYKYGWDIERAITQPVKRKVDALWPKYRDLAEQSGISYMCFYLRIKKMDMAPEEAATTPIIPRTGRTKKNAKLTKEIVETAAKNGISRKTLSQRVYVYRWDVERATTEPLHKEKRSRVRE